MDNNQPTPLTEDSIMKFGRHHGKPIKEVPAKMLIWLYNNRDKAPNYNGTLKVFHWKLMEYVEKNMDKLIKEKEAQK